MAVKTFKISGVSALVLALSVLSPAAMAQSDPDRERPSWRGGEQTRAPRSEAGNSGWQRPSPQTQNAPSSGWSGRSNTAPAPQVAPPAPPPQSRSAWGNAGGNSGNWEGRGNRRNEEARGNGEERSEDRGPDRSLGWRGMTGRAPTAPTGEVATPPAPPRTVGWNGTGDRPRRDGDGVRDHDGRRDGDGVRDRDGRRDNWRDRDNRGQTTGTSWGSGRSDSWRDRDGRRDGDSWRDRDGRRDGDRWRDGDRRTSWNSGSYNNNHRRWDRRWRDNHRYNWHSYRSNYPSYFNVGVYYSPYRNYRYRRLSIGYFLDSLFYSDRYWIADPWQYRLPDAYGPYRWVRYYDDALLVNVYTGEVVDVINRFFW